jgi:hypothetical protein
MKRFIVHWRGWCLVTILLFGTPLSASAQDKRVVEAGKTAVLIDMPASAPISAASAAQGLAEIKASADGKRSTLIYTAPSSGVIDDIVNYIESGLSKTIAVRITGAGATGKTLTDAETYEPTFKILFAIFVLALVLESGLAVLFNWRPFVMTFDARGVKTLVSLAFSLFFVLTFRLDLCTGLVNILWAQNYHASFPGYVVTALVLAGGSSAVNNLMVSLGFRSLKTVETVVPKPPPTKAWISVSLKRNVAIGPVHVLLTRTGGQPMVVGSINGTSPQHGLIAFFLRDKGRFPSWGGYAVEPGQSYTVALAGRDPANVERTSVPSAVFTPEAGAIVDLALEL